MGKDFRATIKEAKEKALRDKEETKQQEEIKETSVDSSETRETPERATPEFLVRARARRAELAPTPEEQPPTEDDWTKVEIASKQGLPTGLEDIGTEVENSSPTAQWMQDVNAACKSITIDEVYQKLPDNKYDKSTSGKTEGKKISCPNPAHPDSNPSAWINTKKGLYYCSGCNEGGDKFVVAAWLYGYPVPGYKKAEHFHPLANRLAKEFRGVDKPPTPSTSPTVTVVEGPPPEEIQALRDETINSGKQGPTYNLASLNIPENSFLGLYLEEALKADVPREFPLFAGLSALSMALGRDFALKMIEEPTYANLAVCLVSPSGTGKGRSTRPVGRVLRAALPHDNTPLSGGLPADGVRVMKLAGSAEALIDNLSEGMASSPALIEFEEMQTLISKSAGNSSYKPYIIEFADCIPLITRSSKAYGSAAVINGYVSFLTGTQPRHLREQFTKRDEDSGLLNRFIFPFGNSVEQNAWEVTPQDWSAAVTELKFVRKWIVTQPGNNPDGNAHWVYVSDWDAGAKELWISEFKARVEPDRQGEQANLLARMSVNMLRLILLFAANSLSARIKVEHVETAFKLYDYLKNCALSLAKEIRSTDVSDSMKEILNVVVTCERKNKKPATLREIKKASAAISQMNAEELGKCIQKLMAARLLHHVKTKRADGRGGRPGDAYTSDMSQWDKASITVEPATSS